MINEGNEDFTSVVIAAAGIATMAEENNHLYKDKVITTLKQCNIKSLIEINKILRKERDTYDKHEEDRKSYEINRWMIHICGIIADRIKQS